MGTTEAHWRPQKYSWCIQVQKKIKPTYNFEGPHNARAVKSSIVVIFEDTKWITVSLIKRLTAMTETNEEAA